MNTNDQPAEPPAQSLSEGTADTPETDEIDRTPAYTMTGRYNAILEKSRALERRLAAELQDLRAECDSLRTDIATKDAQLAELKELLESLGYVFLSGNKTT